MFAASEEGQKSAAREGDDRVGPGDKTSCYGVLNEQGEVIGESKVALDPHGNIPTFIRITDGTGAAPPDPVTPGHGNPVPVTFAPGDWRGSGPGPFPRRC